MLGRCGLVCHRTFILSGPDSIFQKCPVGFCVLSVSSLRLILPCSLNEMTVSLAGLHVSHEFIPVFFRSYAFKRGKFCLFISSEDGHLDDMFSRTKFSSLVLSIRRHNEPNGGLNIGLYSRMMPFLGTSRLR